MIPIASSPRILLVEDDLDIRETLAEVFVDEGYEVSTAANGQEALDHLLKIGTPMPEVILLDLMMPVMDGWQFHAAQQNYEALARIPVIVLSADGMPQRGRSINAVGWFRKPLNAARLLEVVEGVCARSQDAAAPSPQGTNGTTTHRLGT